MNVRPWSRRTLLLQGTALMSAVALWRAALAGMTPGQGGDTVLPLPRLAHSCLAVI